RYSLTGPNMRIADAEEFFKCRQARDEVGTLFIQSLRRLGDYELRGDLRAFRAPYAVSNEFVFGGASSMNVIYYSLDAADRRIALATGAEAADLGDDWVKFLVFRAGWPRPDLEHWALAAY